jgi:hypothetical protein
MPSNIELIEVIVFDRRLLAQLLMRWSILPKAYCGLPRKGQPETTFQVFTIEIPDRNSRPGWSMKNNELRTSLTCEISEPIAKRGWAVHSRENLRTSRALARSAFSLQPQAGQESPSATIVLSQAQHQLLGRGWRYNRFSLLVGMNALIVSRVGSSCFPYYPLAWAKF